MPSYELALLLRTLPKPELKSTLKRTANSIFKCGGIIRTLENLGKRPTPYKINNHGSVHREANYFVVLFDAPPSKLEHLKNEYRRDIDIIRSSIYKANSETPDYECTIDEEMKPAPYRAEVIKLMEQIKKKNELKPQFKYNTGLDYYPFQK